MVFVRRILHLWNSKNGIAMKTCFKLLCIILVLVSCKQEVPVPEQCGTVKTHVVDAAYTEKYQLPNVSFSVNYFDSMKVNLPKDGKKNSNFAVFVVDDGGDAEERIAFGSYKLTGITADKLDESFKGLLESIKGLYEFTYKLSDQVNEKKVVNGVQRWVYEAVGTEKYTDTPKKVLIRTTLHSANPLDANGLMVMQIANPNGAIKTHAYFAGNSCTAYVYKTITFK